MSARREFTVLRLERQQKDFLKSTSNSHITLSFLFIWNWDDIYVHAFPRKPYPNSDQNRQSLYPFSDQNGVKPLPFGAAHTYEANTRKYPPPNRHRTKYSSSCYPKFSTLTDSSHSVQNHRYPRVLGLACKIKQKWTWFTFKFMYCACIRISWSFRPCSLLAILDDILILRTNGITVWKLISLNEKELFPSKKTVDKK